MYVCILSFEGNNGKQYTENKTKISAEEYKSLSDAEKNCFVDEDVHSDNTATIQKEKSSWEMYWS